MTIEKFISEPRGPGLATTMEKLREWCGERVIPKELECYECMGTSEAPCPHCGQPMECGECDGTGKVTEQIPTRPGRICGILINRDVIAGIPVELGGEVFVDTPNVGKTVCLRIMGSDWIVAIAHMIQQYGKPDGEMPTFEVAA